MKPALLLIVMCASFFIGAVSHESDIARNCRDKGNAHAWFVEINCK